MVGERAFRLGVDGRVLDDRYHGIGRVTEALLREMSLRPDVDVVVFLRPGQESRRFDLAALTEGLGHGRAPLDGSLTSPLQWLRWPGALRAAGVESVLFPYNLGAALSGPARRFAIVHDCILESDARFAPNAVTRWSYMAVTRAVLSRCGVIAPSAASARALHEVYRRPTDSMTVIPWGVDADTFAVPVGDPRSRGSGARRGPYLLHVGARRPHKNVVTLIRALARLPEEIRLVLVGSVDERMPDPVPATAAALGVEHRIEHLPQVSDADLAALYRGAHVFVFPSLVEGYGLPLLEAMAAGAPVVASDIPVFREVAGEAAELVAAEDPEAWADAVTRLGDPRRRTALVDRGRDRAQTASWARAADQLIAAVRPGAQQ